MSTKKQFNLLQEELDRIIEGLKLSQENLDDILIMKIKDPSLITSQKMRIIRNNFIIKLLQSTHRLQNMESDF